MYSLAMLLVLSNPAVAADPGTVITNTAMASYGAGIVNDITEYSNTVIVTTAQTGPMSAVAPEAVTAMTVIG